MDKELKKKKIRNFDDLDVYQKLCKLHLEISNVSLSFPNYELYELGSQLRRSSNGIAANLAEGWNNRHINVYLEGINRAMGELRETQHHLYIAHQKQYLSETKFKSLRNDYFECGRMLKGLERSLLKFKTKPNPTL
jgi:four helix bundle protein